MSRGLAQRYARAIVSEAYEQKQQKQVIDALCLLGDAIRAYPELKSALNNVTLKAQQKEALLKPLLDHQSAPELVHRFVSVVGKNGRLGIFDWIADEAFAQYEAREGVQLVTVTSADTCPETEAKKIQKAFEDALKTKVRLEFKTDDSLLAGHKAQVGSTVFDGSLLGRIQRMRNELSKE